MKAIGYTDNGPAAVLTDLELSEPTPGARDLLVEVRAISVNPVDTKVRTNTAPDDGDPKVLGWDVAGVVRSVGAEVTLFSPGDEVWYAGSITRPGANSELHVVDERIVALKPTSLDFAQAAAMPLTVITAWELLFDRLGVPREGGAGRSLLVVGAAGGVGSALVQLARNLTGLRIVATASRPQTQAWVSELGAHDVIDHSEDMLPQLREAGLESVDLVASLTGTGEHFPTLAEALTPQGRIGVIDDPAEIDARLLKQKAGSLHWEFMFARAKYETPDMIEQHRLLTEVAGLVDEGVLVSTIDETYGEITAANLVRAHEFIESGRAKGKIVLAGWPDAAGRA